MPSFHPDIIAILTRLGWDEQHLKEFSRSNDHRSKLEESFIATMPRRGNRRWDPEVVQLKCDHEDAEGLDEIPSKILDCRDKAFEKQVFFWVTKATFALQGIRAKHAARDQQRDLKKRRMADWNAKLRGDCNEEDWEDVAQPSFDLDGNLIDVKVHYHWNLHTVVPGATHEEKAAAIRRAIAFLRAEGWKRSTE